MKKIFLMFFTLILHESHHNSLIASEKTTQNNSLFAQLKQEFILPSETEIKQITDITILNNLITKLSDQYDTIENLLQSKNNNNFSGKERCQASIYKPYNISTS
jgi:hypothetical protein